MSIALAEWSEQGLISQVTNQLYMNQMSKPKPRVDETSSRLRQSSIVSGQRVLGDSGVLYNPTLFITSVMSSSDSKKAGKLETKSGTFVFSVMPPEMFPSENDAIYNDCFDSSFQYKRSTPEKAIIDLIHLNSTPAGKSIHSLPPADRWDWDEVDMDKLARLISSFNMTDKWNAVCQSIGQSEFPFNSNKNATRSFKP